MTGANGSEPHIPLKFPLDEVLMINVFSRKKGVKLHALGVEYKDKGIIFSGVSGAGKSTTAELWKQRDDATLLSDESVVVRPGGCIDQTGSKANFATSLSNADQARGGFCLYGTPRHGDARVSAYGGVRLERILFLVQADENRLVPLEAAKAATALLVRCFPTFWNEKGMDFTVELVSRICTEVPCFELRFRPDKEALETAVEGL
jgi:hypothetical protein